MFVYLDNVTMAITILAAFVILLYVCIPMNNRPCLEKVFFLCVFISTLGASLDRISRIWEAYDTGGEVKSVAMLLVTFARAGVVIFGMMCIMRFLQQKKETTQAVVRLHDRLEAEHSAEHAQLAKAQ